MNLRWVAAMLLLTGGAAEGDSGENEPDRHLVVITGIGGEEYYQDLFYRWGLTMAEVAIEVARLPATRVTFLSEDPSRHPSLIGGSSRKVEIAAALERAAVNSRPGDLVFLVLIGHGTAREDRALFNLPGPDLSADELDEMLEALAGRRVVIANTTPASGPFVAALSGPDRLVITATSSRHEDHHTRFGGYFVAAFAEPRADANKDRRISLLEAFRFAREEVRREFESDRRLITEHALLDDDGDGVGTREPRAEEGDGAQAHRVFLAPPTAPAAALADQRATLLALEIEARALVEKVETLKRRKKGLFPDEYLDQLEAFLIQLALNRRRAREIRTP